MNINWCLATALGYDNGSSGSSNLLGRVSGATFGDPSCAANGGQTVSEAYSYTAGGLVTWKGYYVVVPMSFGGNGSIEYSGYSYGPTETYSWDSEGNQTGYGSFAYTLDAMGRATGLTETGPGTVWVQNASYGPGGEAQGLQYRTSSGAYYSETRSYNNLNQLKQLTASASGLAGMNLRYGYGTGTNNGQIAAMTDGNSGEQVTYTYDALKRLQKAETTQSQTQYPNASWWGQSFGYDGFGNLLSKTATTGHTATSMSVGVDPSTNRLSGLDYANQRYYSSVYGRFTSVDRYRLGTRPESPGSWNRYAYVMGDPVNSTDPSGMLRIGCDDPTAESIYDGSCNAVSGDYGYPGGLGCDEDGGYGFISNANTMVSCAQVPTVGAGGGSAHPTPPPPLPPPPQCLTELGYQGAVYPNQHAVNHSYLYVQGPGAFEILNAGPTRLNPFVPTNTAGVPGLVWVGWGPMITASSPNGMYNEATNSGSTVIWAQYEPCSVVNRLIADTVSLNGKYEYGGWTSNSNSFTYSLLNDVGLAGQVPVPPRAPGWETI